MKEKEIELILEQLQQSIQQAQQKVSRLGLVRLGLLLGLIICLLTLLIEKNLIFVLPLLVLALLFGYFITLQDKYKQQLCHQQAKQKIYERIKQAKQAQYIASGVLASEQDAYYIGDLDVVGKDSLYDCLAFSFLQAGQERLKERLCQPLNNQKEILEMQDVFQELGFHKVSVDYLCEEELLDRRQKVRLTKEDLKVLPKMPSYLKLFTAIYPLGLIVCFLCQRFDLTIYLMLASLMMAGLHFRFFFQGYALTSQRVMITSGFDKLCQVVLQTSFKNTYLTTLQKEMASLYAQKRQLNLFDQFLKVRYNPLLLMILDGLFFYDGWLYLILARQKEASYLLTLQDKLADFSALSSLAQWLKIKEQVCYPIFSEQLTALDLKHPLMSSCQAVGADFKFEGGTVVITGSNMAGKTTFMRNIGLNLVLFYCGLPVTAKHFEAPLLKIHTSMRVADRTQEGVSTFYGELLRIKEMVKASETKVPSLYLIDEIFKGTNLKDRIIGAKATIERLNAPYNFLFVSTHDEALTAHESVAIENIHFSEHYENNQIHFDYLLKKGIARTTNAIYLMKMIGLLE